MIQWRDLGGSLDTIKENALTLLGLKVTTRTELKKQSHMIQDLREPSSGFPSSIFKRSTGSTTITNTKTQGLRLLIMTVYRMLISSLVVISVQLLLACIMLTPYFRTGTILAPVVIVINALCILKMGRILQELLGLLQVVSKEEKSLGQDKQIGIGGKV